MNISKHLDFFNPEDINCSIHVIGCGAVGSTVIENLARLGVKEIHIWDFDTVEPHNITNQMFYESQIGMKKTEAIKATVELVNYDIDIIEHGEWTGKALSGYVFLCVDNIELRRKIVLANQFNANTVAMFDFRIGLTEAQHYATDMTQESIGRFLKTMEFTHEEAKEATPTSACGTTLSVVSTVRIIVGYGISNFINYTLKKPIKEMVLVDAFNFNVIA